MFLSLYDLSIFFVLRKSLIYDVRIFKYKSFNPGQKARLSKVKKRIGRVVECPILVDHEVIIKEKEKERQVLWHVRKLKGCGCDGDDNCNWHTRNDLLRFNKDTGRVRNRRTNRELLAALLRSDRILRKKSGDLRRLLITQTPGIARGVMVIVIGNGHGDTSSNLGPS